MGGCCGLTGSLYDGGVSPALAGFRATGAREGTAGGRRQLHTHATGERAFESLGGGASQANSPEPPSEMSCLLPMCFISVPILSNGSRHTQPKTGSKDSTHLT